MNLALAYTELTEELCRLRNLSSLQSQILRALLQEKSLNGGKGGPRGLAPHGGMGLGWRKREDRAGCHHPAASAECPSWGASVPKEWSPGAICPGNVRPQTLSILGTIQPIRVSIPRTIHPGDHPARGTTHPE